MSPEACVQIKSQRMFAEVKGEMTQGRALWNNAEIIKPLVSPQSWGTAGLQTERAEDTSSFLYTQFSRFFGTKRTTLGWFMSYLLDKIYIVQVANYLFLYTRGSHWLNTLPSYSWFTCSLKGRIGGRRFRYQRPSFHPVCFLNRLSTFLSCIVSCYWSWLRLPELGLYSDPSL